MSTKKATNRGRNGGNPLGRKVGTKFSDRRWESPDGQQWDSRYEYCVWLRLEKESKGAVRRCTKGDTLAFILPIRGGVCGTCSSTEVGQQRRYTPDFFIATHHKEHSTVKNYIEAKGYLRAKERSLLRNLYKTYPNLGLRIILQRDYTINKRTGGSIVDWFTKFLPKYLVEVWHESKTAVGP